MQERIITPMLKTNPILKRSMVGMMIFVQVVFFPAFALANDPATPGHACGAANGTTRPTGSDGHMYNFNLGTCLWENQYYTWDPITKVETPLQNEEIQHDDGSKEKITWVYSPAAGAYTKRVQVTAAPVANAPAANMSNPTGQNAANNPAGGTAATTANPTGAANGQSVGSTGPNSNNTIGNNQNNNGTITLSNGVTITNGISSTALTGNANVLQNTTGGNANTGDAEAIANILNLLQSSWNPANGNISMFNANINDHVGDLLLDPSAILNTGPNSNNAINNNANNQLDINIQNDGRIVNNVDLAAQSGDARVSGNTTGGDATTGDANAVANIFNLVNSMISPGSAFIGTINILGNLNGDILLPSLLSSIANTGPNSSNTVGNNQNNNVNVASVDNRSVTNNTNLSAASGNAVVSGNTNGGAATTGSAGTNLNIYNMMGQNVTGTNGLLVFTNVLGHWAGFLFDAPAGTNSVLGTGPGSTNTVNNNANNTLNIDSTNNTAIENNVTANAQSGNATVSGNTTGGNATTGDATASANIVNLINSQLSFSDWFGVLFINVFGSWTGDFGNDTAAGNRPTASGSAGQNTRTSGQPPASPAIVAHAFMFTREAPEKNGTAASAGSGNSSFGSQGSGTGTAANTPGEGSNTRSNDTAILASSTTPTNSGGKTANAGAAQTASADWTFTIMGIIIASTLLGAERFLTIRQRRSV